MLPQIPKPEDYDVSPTLGFLPTELPLEVLPDTYYTPWETIAKNLQGLILSRRMRGVVERLPILSTEHLRSEPEWRRAYSILAFISHAYIWSGDRPAEVVPSSISIPFLSTCTHLELPPVATYAAVALWNYKPLFEDEPIGSLSNLATLHTFTGSLDESWFYLISVAIESRAGPIIPLMLEAMHAVRNGDIKTVTDCLQSFAERLDELGVLLGRMYEQCDPHVFYHRIRPFLAGSKNMADAGLPNGVIFDDGTGKSEYVQYSGGSNAQSSIIQFFDLCLGVDHRPTGIKPNSSTSAASSSDSTTTSATTTTTSATNTTPSTTTPPTTTPPPSSNNFIHEMRLYMPGPHRRFLLRIAAVANIRPFVEHHASDASLTTAFDACLAMLRAFRDRHVQMVSRYIIVKSREVRRPSISRGVTSPPTSATGSGVGKVEGEGQGQKKINLANVAATGAGEERKSLKGTGGTALIPFLKQARDETGEPAVGNWARRLLTGSGAGSGLGSGKRSRSEDRQAQGQRNGEGQGVQIKGLSGIWTDNGDMGGICHW